MIEKLEKEIEVLAKEVEDLIKSSILTRADTEIIDNIRKNFKSESEEQMRIAFLETKKKYILLEKEAIETAKQQRLNA